MNEIIFKCDNDVFVRVSVYIHIALAIRVMYAHLCVCVCVHVIVFRTDCNWRVLVLRVPVLLTAAAVAAACLAI